MYTWRRRTSYGSRTVCRTGTRICIVRSGLIGQSVSCHLSLAMGAIMAHGAGRTATTAALVVGACAVVSFNAEAADAEPALRMAPQGTLELTKDQHVRRRGAAPGGPRAAVSRRPAFRGARFEAGGCGAAAPCDCLSGLRLCPPGCVLCALILQSAVPASLLPQPTSMPRRPVH
jgi:hypothetical protein